MPVRLSGMATGLDTDTLVKQLMSVKKMPIDKMRQKQTNLEWTRDAYREMNTLMSKLRDAADKIRFDSKLLVKTATLSNNLAFSATPQTTAANSNFTLKVNQLATQAIASSTSAVSATTFSTAGASTLTINGQDITINQNSSMTDIVSAINANSSATGGVTASYDSVTQRLYLTHPETGSTNSKIDVSGDATLLSELNMTAGSYVGRDAMVDYTDAAGNTISVTQQSNSFTLNNVDIVLKQKVVDTSGNPVAVNVSIAPDTDTVFDSIKSFVDAYNDVVDKVNGKISEKRYRDYQPLTQDQKNDMKENEIEMWEEKAKSGLLRNDDTLKSALFSYRNMLSGTVGGIASGNYNSLYDIGITTAAPGVSSNYTENGKLYIDEDKLKKAIAENPEQVATMFTKAVDSGDASRQSGGFAERLYQVANDTMSRLTKMAGSSANTVDTSTIGLKISDLGRDIDVETSKLDEYEQKYYSDFAKLEAAMQKMNAQSAWLASQFGGQ
ncbi:MAG TPA: flagellar filament capping protein FliD [Bacilli bacterium]|nr:flagellar filament capping protein FliD [Bacilli bacterium]